ncbi:ATP-binding cassette domain-containing protein [Micromonospora sp. PTRAS2]|uniref:ATP-binding cassette domain-containing protein n=1 Tax=unclassified Micromonospora TaxID=2617518 RepID=UPI00098D4024|nr:MULTISPECIES: ATP-binding cassette domain-containing protein [unclassified Micromonospora]MDI5941659.1 ATP-binding cassette domain-containing protein [Micromonospora sp. DH15]OON28549.1 ABC transporter ATP-binding protein [Micromonospora sp. Rc5]
MIEARRLTRVYGGRPVVDTVTFTVEPGRVTGFLGLNGSGKTTTLRMLLGLVRPTSGVALVDGRPYRELVHPLRQVGAVVEQGACHPGQTGRAHLRTQAILAGAGQARADLLLERVGLAEAADRRAGGYSLGMRQRLSIATALLGDPPVLVLDEPGNGLDPAGIAWLRGLLRDHARAGGTVLVSSHLLAEVAQLVDDVVVIARGRVLRQAPLARFTGAATPRVRVRGRDPQRLWHVFTAAGATVTADVDRLGQARADDQALEVVGLTAEHLGELAFRAGVPVHELTPLARDVEQVFLDLVGPA